MTAWHSQRYLIPILAILLASFACDTRTSVDRSRPLPTFTVDMTVVRDYLQERDVADIVFKRDGAAFTGAEIKIGDNVIPSAGNGRFFAQTPDLTLFPRVNEITFSSPGDNYSRILSFDLPDSFSITSVDPQFNQGATDVTVEWSPPAGATRIILVVIARDYPSNDTAPLKLILDSGTNTFTIRDTTFEDAVGNVVPDTYYIYLAAFNQGFGSYDGIEFPLPDGLPQRRVSDPSGYMRYGTVAPVDSIIVPL